MCSAGYHEEIRHWAEERGERPAMVKRTGKDGNVGIIRIDFPGYSEANLTFATHHLI
jgi:hypothetical protein